MSIRARVTVAVLGTTAFALVTALATLLALQRVSDRDTLGSRAQGLAALVAAQAGEPLSLAEDERVEGLLAALGGQEDVLAAAVWDADRYRVASFTREGQEAPTTPPPPGAHHEPGRTVAVETVVGPEDDARMGSVYVAMDEGVLAGALRRSLAVFAVVFALSLLPGLFVAQRLRRGLAEPLRGLAEAAERVARGDFGTRVVIERDDELGSLGHSFDRMAESLRGLAGNVGASAREVLAAADTLRASSDSSREQAQNQDASVRATESRLEGMESTLEELSQVTHKLSGLTQDAATSANEVEASAGSVADNMQELRASIDATTSAADQSTALAEGIAGRVVRLDTAADSAVQAVEGLGSSVRDVASRGQQSRALWEAAAEEVDQGRRAAADTAGAMERLQERFGRLDRAMHELEERSVSIGDVVRVIEGVARETALLSLNASIIASQAGDHGRAFGVVAGQIKHLADRTESSTKEIQTLVDDVQARTHEAVAATEEGGEAVEAGVRLSGQAGRVLERLLAAAHESAETGRGIESATVRQTEELQGVAREIESLREGLRETRGDVEEQSAAMAAIVAAMKRVQNVTAEATRAAGEQRAESERIGRMVREIDELTEQLRSAAGGHVEGSRELLGALSVFRRTSAAGVEQSETLARVVEQLGQRARALEEELGALRTGGDGGGLAH